ncbi:DUF5320 domain-containing protein [Patescibacteria group bacterium]|nr:DUF5320 domain-containing protein [Patescibacteria group bacterium]MBU0776669.1 DUF5320 domain-containing protein [Patescibacteria group bacterium]MBU0846011.1 DUF5320 domain-containing protein [Patescibacteria group bacterium]MBU0922489.1 DUF5320 domain-containing protein [Patescibacteria group bacterium]MBU1066778.1 DUF5320 domain-containing protein [Patescibacteria group bacterium]
MPKYDGTGPRGMGPRTGRGFGPCGLGLGWRQRFGGERGMGRYFNWNWPQTPKDQLEALDDYKKALEEELEDVSKERVELSKDK